MGWTAFFADFVCTVVQLSKRFTWMRVQETSESVPSLRTCFRIHKTGFFEKQLAHN